MSLQPDSTILPVNALNFEREVLESELPVLIDVWATWCAPCKAAHPIVAALAETHRGQLEVVAIDNGKPDDDDGTVPPDPDGGDSPSRPGGGGGEPTAPDDGGGDGGTTGGGGTTPG